MFVVGGVRGRSGGGFRVGRFLFRGGMFQRFFYRFERLVIFDLTDG